MLTLFVVSDATGDTAERIVQAALVQFGAVPVEVVRRAHIQTAEQVRGLVREARASNAIIMHTLVSDELRRGMRTEARTQGVDALDIIGPILERLTTRLKMAPRQQPGLLKSLLEAKNREVEAVAFAFKHDDGHNVQDLDRAEVVLVGISRTMKTPTMLYLAYRGWYAANVPLVPGLDPPQALLRQPPDRIFCLTMSPEKLQQLRRSRAEQAAIPAQTYSSLEQIRSELLFMTELCRKHRWRLIDTTAKSVEEVARDIIGWLEEE